MKTKKIFAIIRLILVFVCISNCTFATLQPGQISGENVSSSVVLTIAKFAGTILGLATRFVMIISIFFLAFLGIKFMIAAANNPYDRADYKKKLIPFLIGGIVAFSSTGLLQVVFHLSRDLAGADEGIYQYANANVEMEIDKAQYRKGYEDGEKYIDTHKSLTKEKLNKEKQTAVSNMESTKKWENSSGYAYYYGYYDGLSGNTQKYQ